MIDYIKGTIAELNPAFAVIDNHGVGYMMNISLLTYDALSRVGQGGEAMLYVHEAIREDAHLLYGFAAKKEREAFLLLISVSGVGPNIARMVLSSMNVEEFQAAIASNNVAMFKSVKGVGAKTAQRIIVDLKDKIKQVDVTLLQEKKTEEKKTEEKTEENKEGENKEKEKEKKKKKKGKTGGAGRFQGLKKEMAERQKEIKNKKKKEDKD